MGAVTGGGGDGVSNGGGGDVSGGNSGGNSLGAQTSQGGDHRTRPATTEHTGSRPLPRARPPVTGLPPGFALDAPFPGTQEKVVESSARHLAERSQGPGVRARVTKCLPPCAVNTISQDTQM